MIDRVEATAPCRVDLAGGTLDIWPLGVLHPRRAHRQRRDRPRGPRRRSSVAIAAGCVTQDGSRIEATDRGELLASPESALVGLVAEHFDLPPVEVALVERLAARRRPGRELGARGGAHRRRRRDRSARRPPRSHATVHLARDLEARLMGLPTGIQDHYPALLGGALEIRHQPGGEVVRRLAVDLEELGRCLMVAYSGGSHLSAANNFEVVARRLRGDRATADRLSAIADAAVAMAASLDAGDLARAGARDDRRVERRGASSRRWCRRLRSSTSSTRRASPAPGAARCAARVAAAASRSSLRPRRETPSPARSRRSATRSSTAGRPHGMRLS